MQDVPSGRAADDIYALWQQLSEQVHRFRHTPHPSATNDALRTQVDSEPDGPLAPALLLWMGDNLLQELRFRDAAQTYRQIVSRYPERRMGGRPWAAAALEQVAVCHERMGEPEQAIDAYRLLQRAFRQETSLAWTHFQIGRIAEEAGNEAEARRAYAAAARASDAPSHTQYAVPDLARRAGARLRADRSRILLSPESLAPRLARALERRDSDALAALASLDHFSVGPVLSERHFVDRDRVLALLAKDLSGSTVRLDPAALRGAGSKRYLETEGWEGTFLRGQVLLVLTRCHYGWEWSGLGLTQLTDAWLDLVGPFERATNQPLALPIKAPWPAGESFRAGGIFPFGLQLALFLSLPWPFGLFALEAASVASACGFGPGGLYYNQPNTHTVAFGDPFAVDFARFQRGVPLFNQTHGTPVLAVADGLVEVVQKDSETGHPTIDNRVQIEHMTQEDRASIALIRLFTGIRLRMRFTSRSLHLDGPNLMPVSMGMFVRQGARLGLMDDTGASVASHLHFSIFDRQLGGSNTNPGGGVRPTPMDGQTLNDSDDGRCVLSSNTPRP